MIVLIAGASHTGKTALAQKLLEKYKYPYLSIDHLKMGLIRSGNTELTPMDDDDLTEYLWPIIREIIKTAVENKQNLIVEGCYIPFDWECEFETEYLCNIKYYCLVMSEQYIKNHFFDIKEHANVIENRIYDECTLDGVLADNAKTLELAKRHNVNYILIDDKYEIDIDLLGIANKNISANMLRSKFYVCPICGNIVRTVGDTTITCCGMVLSSLEAKEIDENHQINITKVEEEHFISIKHDMTKNHYISFVCYVTSDRVQFQKFYPEGNAETRLNFRGGGCLYIYCNQHGLMKKKI